MKETITLTFNQEQLTVLEAGLKELPGKYCIPMLENIMKQIQEQNKPEEPKQENKKDKK